jgi:hypothetical protein
MSTAPHRPRPLRRRGAARVIPESIPATAADEEALVEHPDGWYWIAPDGRQQFGPFASCSLARADRESSSIESVDEGQTLHELQRESGIDEHMDPERGYADDDGPLDIDRR